MLNDCLQCVCMYVCVCGHPVATTCSVPEIPVLVTKTGSSVPPQGPNLLSAPQVHCQQHGNLACFLASSTPKERRHIIAGDLNTGTGSVKVCDLVRLADSIACRSNCSLPDVLTLDGQDSSSVHTASITITSPLCISCSLCPAYGCQRGQGPSFAKVCVCV